MEASLMEKLIAALRDDDEDIRIMAAVDLMQIGEPAVEPLLAVLRDADAVGRSCAASILGQIGDARAVELLATALYDLDVNVCRSAAYALHKIGTPEALAAIEQWRASSSAESRLP
jgi:HEAT repeat protein